jgi:hypothetical protein
MKIPLLGVVALVACLFCSSVSYAQPVISGFSPASGEVGILVTIAGTGLLNTTAVTFNGVP